MHPNGYNLYSFEKNNIGYFCRTISKQIDIDIILFADFRAKHSAKRCKYEFSPHVKVKITKNKIHFFVAMRTKTSAAPIEIGAAYMCYSLIISRESSSIMLLICTLPPGERFPRLVPCSCSSPSPTESCLLP